DETYPALDATLLREVLDFSAAIDGGKAIALEDAAEGEQAIALSQKDRVLFRKNPIVVRDGTIGLTEKDPDLMGWVGKYVLHTRWNDLWPHWVQPEEDRKAQEAASASLKAAGDRLAKTIEKAAAPKGPRELVLEGKVGKWEKVDLKKERPLEAETV